MKDDTEEIEQEVEKKSQVKEMSLDSSNFSLTKSGKTCRREDTIPSETETS